MQQFDPYDFSKKEIDSVPIYYKNLPWAPCVHLYVTFNVGAFSDPAGKEGLSHFLEHLIFNGSGTLPDKKSVEEWSKKYALRSWNAWTSFYQTTYHLKCLPENVATVLEGMKDMIFYPLLKPEDVEHERQVITQEQWGRFHNEKYLSYLKEIQDIVYHGHNYSRLIAPGGLPKTVADISPEDIYNWHAKKYVKENMSIVMTGSVTDKDVALLQTFVQNLPTGQAYSYVKNEIKKPLVNRYVKNSEDIGDPKEQVEITISRSLSKLPEEKHQLAALLRALLSDILNERLRIEKGICYGVSVNTWLDVDIALAYMNVETDEKNIELVEKEFWNILTEIYDGKHVEKFNVIKNLMLQQIRSHEWLSDGIANKATKDIIRLEGKIMTLEQTLSETEKIAYENISDFAREIFNPEYMFTEIILPAKNKIID